MDVKLRKAQLFYDSLEQASPRERTRWITPTHAKRSTIVHLLKLGSSARNPEIFAGDSFIMHNLVSSIEGINLSPRDLFIDLTTGDFELETRKFLEISRSLRRTMLQYDVGSFNYYLLHYYLMTK